MKFDKGPPGVTAWVTLDDQVLPISDIQYDFAGRVEGIEDRCDPRLHVQGNRKNLLFLSDRNTNDISPLGFLTARKIKVRYAKTEEKYLRTLSNYNNIRVLSLNFSSAPTVFTFALVTQEGEPFLSCDPTYQFGLLVDNGKFVWTYPRKWPSLTYYVELATKCETVLRPPHFPASYNWNSRGEVEWWDSSLGFGSVWILHEGEKIRVAAHWSQIKREGDFIFLRPGEMVTYEEVCKKVVTKYNSEFKYELVGVMPVAA